MYYGEIEPCCSGPDSNFIYGISTKQRGKGALKGSGEWSTNQHSPDVRYYAVTICAAPSFHAMRKMADFSPAASSFPLRLSPLLCLSESI